MTIPAILFGTVIALLLGALGHFITSGSGRQLIVNLLFSLAGFWVGHVLGGILNFNFLSLGPVRMGMAVLGSILGIVLGMWLNSPGEAERRNKQ